MHITENAPHKLTLQSRSLLLGVVFAIGAVLWLVSVAGSTAWGAVGVSTQQPLPSFYWLRIAGLAVYFVFGLVLAWLVGGTAFTVLTGTTCTFDRQAERVHITRPTRWRTTQRELSLYGVSHALAEHNEELKTIALYLVLRSGERIPLGVCQAFEDDEAEQILGAVRAFLRGR